MSRKWIRESLLEDGIALATFVGATAVALLVMASSVATSGLRVVVERRRRQTHA